MKGRLALQKLDNFLSELRHSRSRTGAVVQRAPRAAPQSVRTLPPAAPCRPRPSVALTGRRGFPVPAVTIGLLSPAEDCLPEERAALGEVRRGPAGPALLTAPACTPCTP